MYAIRLLYFYFMNRTINVFILFRLKILFVKEAADPNLDQSKGRWDRSVLSDQNDKTG